MICLQIFQLQIWAVHFFLRQLLLQNSNYSQLKYSLLHLNGFSDQVLSGRAESCPSLVNLRGIIQLPDDCFHLCDCGTDAHRKRDSGLKCWHFIWQLQSVAIILLSIASPVMRPSIARRQDGQPSLSFSSLSPQMQCLGWTLGSKVKFTF